MESLHSFTGLALHRQQQHSYYYDMSTSTSTSSSSSCSSAISNGVRKQVLELKPKAPVFGQRLENKVKKDVPITTLQLKSKEKVKLDKNIVTNLVYRKPGNRDHVETNQMSQAIIYLKSRRPGSPSSSGYETDNFSFGDLENCENSDPFSTFVEEQSSNYGTMMLGMLNSHPIWAPANNLFPPNNDYLL